MINLKKNRVIVRSNGPIGLFGGGETTPEDLSLVLNRVKFAVAADSGASALIDSGQVPDAVIGDFDSLTPEVKSRIPSDRLFPVTEQNSTDFDKALRHVSSPLVVGVGFLGGRLDHQLAVLNTLVRYQDRACVLVGAHEVVFHIPPRIALDLEPGGVLSLFPLKQVTGRSRGLEWPIEGLAFDPGGQVGTSNRVVSRVTLQMDGPGMLAMVPRAALDQVMQAFLSGQSAPWPSRAE